MAPAARSRNENKAAVTAAPAYIDYIVFSAGGTSVCVLQEPVVLPPGSSLAIELVSVNVTVIRADLREALVRVAMLEEWRRRVEGKA